MKKILLSLVILSLSLGVSEASLVYTTVNGNMGIVDYSAISGDMIVYPREYSTQNVAIVASYLHNGYSKTLLVEPDDLKLDEGGSWDRFYMFDSANLTTPENYDEDLRLTGISGATSIVTAVNGEQTSVFVADINGSIAEYRSGNTEPRNYFSYPEFTGYDSAFMKVMIAGERLFVLNMLLDEDDGYVYEALMFDGLLERNRSFSSFDLGSDVNDIAVTSSGLIFATYDNGIRQYKNRKTVEDVLTLDSGKATAIYAISRTTFYFVIEDSNANTSTLAYYDGSAAYNVYTAPSVGTLKSKITYDSKNNLVGAIIGDGIVIVDNANLTVSDFVTADELGGAPVSIAFVGASTLTNKSSSSGSGGCASVSLSLIGALLLALPLISRKK